MLPIQKLLFQRISKLFRNLKTCFEFVQNRFSNFKCSNDELLNTFFASNIHVVCIKSDIHQT